MGFVNGKGVASDFKIESSRYSHGFALLVDLVADLPRKYISENMGESKEKGFNLHAYVVQAFGDPKSIALYPRNTEISVVLRPGDVRGTIFDDLSKTNEGVRFLLEGVTGGGDTGLHARWAHGAGANRKIEFVEVIGAPRLTFVNPCQNDGPASGWLQLNLNGAPTEFSLRSDDGTFATYQFSYDEIVNRLRIALDQNLNIRVSQRALMPSKAVLVDDDEDLKSKLSNFRNQGFTSCVVRSFAVGTNDEKRIDVQILSWPQDVPEGPSYAMPSLRDTSRLVALRDGEAPARMEIIPGFILSLVGNKDVDKSTKHRFAHNVVKGLSDKQKRMYGAQSYGPGVAISAVNESGEQLGISRLAVRVEGPQYQRLLAIRTPHFDSEIIQNATAGDDALVDHSDA